MKKIVAIGLFAAAIALPARAENSGFVVAQVDPQPGAAAPSTAAGPRIPEPTNREVITAINKLAKQIAQLQLSVDQLAQSANAQAQAQNKANQEHAAAIRDLAGRAAATCYIVARNIGVARQGIAGFNDAIHSCRHGAFYDKDVTTAYEKPYY
jgi:TolA-binding protein